MESNQLTILLAFWNDALDSIAASKIQRWEVIKWTVTANVALAAASAGFKSSPIGFVLLCVLIAMMGIVLLEHYNDRMTRVRWRLQKLNAHIADNVIDMNRIADVDYLVDKPRNYDREELLIFRCAIACSVFPALAVLFIGRA